MNQSLKLLAALLALITPAISTAQELHTFSNGEVADAEKINENFQYVLKNASGGCSATQDRSNVVITCADGSSGVLASAGTVVVYPEGGMIGKVSETLSSGQIVFKDANDVVVAAAVNTVEVTHAAFEIEGRELLGNFYNDHESQQVVFSGWTGDIQVYFQSTDCTGQPLGTGANWVYEVQGKFLTAAKDVQRQSYLTMSVFSSGSANFSTNSYRPSGECQSIPSIRNGVPLVNLALPEEIINAAYPVRLEQLP